ncbi:flagellar motor switch protein FliG [Albirhodobacter sp. R86504]|uniref:flagellar motor switch protein FliG n=1 Tax=Albirhodobacter sp. R86504 TaxID=3093848 RepID=UPI0036710616
MNAIAPLPDLGQSFPAAPRAGKPITNRQKAAIVVRLLSSEGLKLPLSDLSEDMQTSLTSEIAEMRLIDRATMAEVVREFCDQLDAVGLAFPGGLDGALKLLDGQLSPSAANRLRRMASGSSRADPWERLTGLGTDVLAPVLEEESTEVGAVVLSKLSVSKAADLLSKLPGDKARRIAYAVSQTGAVAPETVHRIGVALASQLDNQPARAFTTGPVERVGAILNYSAAATRDSVLQGLEEDDADFAEQVRKAIFTFANIPNRIDARDIPKILRNVEQPVLVVALAGATGALAPAAEFILANMSQRMAASLRDEGAALGKIKAKDAEEAMGAVVSAIREMESAGEIFLLADAED